MCPHLSDVSALLVRSPFPVSGGNAEGDALHATAAFSLADAVRRGAAGHSTVRAAGAGVARVPAFAERCERRASLWHRSRRGRCWCCCPVWSSHCCFRAAAGAVLAIAIMAAALCCRWRVDCIPIAGYLIVVVVVGRRCRCSGQRAACSQARGHGPGPQLAACRTGPRSRAPHPRRRRLDTHRQPRAAGRGAGRAQSATSRAEGKTGQIW
jgi:hypothetical protein